MHKNIKPYFVEDLTAWLKAAYFSLAINSRGNREFWRGVLATLATLAFALDINPDTLFTAEDAQLLRSNK